MPSLLSTARTFVLWSLVHLVLYCPLRPFACVFSPEGTASSLPSRKPTVISASLSCTQFFANRPNHSLASLVPKGRHLLCRRRKPTVISASHSIHSVLCCPIQPFACVAIVRALLVDNLIVDLNPCSIVVQRREFNRVVLRFKLVVNAVSIRRNIEGFGEENLKNNLW